MDTKIESNSSDEITGAQTALAEIDPDQMHDAAGELQASVSRFAREDEENQESRVMAMKQVSAQLRTINAKVQGTRAKIDTLASQMSNYRS